MSDGLFEGKVKVGNIAKWEYSPQAALGVVGPDATVNTETQELLYLLRRAVPGVKNSNSIAFRVGADLADPNFDHTRLDINLSGDPVAVNRWGEIPDKTVMTLLSNGKEGKVNVGNITEWELFSPQATLSVVGPEATVNTETQELLYLLRRAVPGVKNSNSIAFRVGADLADPNFDHTRLDINLSGDPVAVNRWGEIPDKTVMTLKSNGNIGIGTTEPLEKLEVSGNVKVSKDIKVKGSINVDGDVVLASGSADCSEEFDVMNKDSIEQGTVMVINGDGALTPSYQAYDKCVAGVVSGGGKYKPGIILDKHVVNENRLPIALVGKVYCKVDAQYGEIKIGDLLTTSPTNGHAMTASDRDQAFGSIIGKALGNINRGKGLIPILVALQ